MEVELSLGYKGLTPWTNMMTTQIETIMLTSL